MPQDVVLAMLAKEPSHGYQLRARALSNEPLVVLADEPTGNLDSAATRDVLRLFETLHEAGQTLVVVRRTSALARALGATPREVSTALAAAQVLPALAGAVLGIFPGGVALLAAINAITGGDSDRATFPSAWQLVTLVLGTVLVVAALTAIPARLGARRPVTEALHPDLA